MLDGCGKWLFFAFVFLAGFVNGIAYGPELARYFQLRFPDRPRIAWLYRKTFCRFGFHWWHRWDDHRGRGKTCDVGGCRAYRSWWEKR